MKASFNIERIIAGHFAWLLVTLPLDKFYGELGLISLTLVSLLNFREMRWSARGLRLAFILAIPFFISLGWAFEGEARHEAWALPGKQAAILLLPFLSSGWSNVLVKYRSAILKWFVAANSLLILGLYGAAFIDIRYAGLPLSAILSGGFTHHHFLQPLDQHASFVSLFWATALLVVLIEDHLFSRAACLALGAIILAGLMQLQSVALLPLALGFLLIRLVQPWRAWKLGLLALIIIASSLLLYQSIYPHLHEELSRHAGLHPEDSRLDRWSAGWELIKSRPWTGYGTGDEKQVLQPVFLSRGLYSSYVNRLNVHNQFLAYLIRSGIPGFCFYVLMLMLLGVQTFRSRNPLLGGCLAALIALSMAEDVLDVQKGIFFLAVLVGFAAFSWQPQRLRTRIHKRVVLKSSLAYEPS